LGLGIACFLLIGLFVRDELSYDRHHEHADSIVRIGIHIFLDGNESNYATAAAPVAQGMKDAFPEVLEGVRMQDASTQIWYEDEVYQEDYFFWSDPTIFDVFTIPMLLGDPGTALTEPGTAVVSESSAVRYFGSVDAAIGETLMRNGDDPWVITGVFEDVPQTSHFHPNIIASILGRNQEENTAWMTQNNFSTYLRLTSAAAIPGFTNKLPALIKERIYPEVESVFGVSAEQLFAAGGFVFQFHPTLHRL